MLETNSLRSLLYATISKTFSGTVQPVPAPSCRASPPQNVPGTLPKLSGPNRNLRLVIFPNPATTLSETLPVTQPGISRNSVHSRPEHYAVEEKHTRMQCIQMYVRVCVYIYRTKKQHHVFQIETTCNISYKIIFVHDLFPSIHLL